MPVDQEIREALEGISERLGAIETTQATFLGRLERPLRDVDSHDRILRGNGIPGLVERVGSIERREQSREWWVRMAAAGGFAAFAKALFDWIGVRH